MHGVILAAGEGSRMGEHTNDRPKAFLELGDQTLYERQRRVLAPHVEEVTVVLGYEADAVRSELARNDRALVFEEWQAYENGESLRRALADICSGRDAPRDDPDSVIVVNGDVVVTQHCLDRLCRRHSKFDESVVGCLPGRQNEHTAIRCDQEGRVTDYGRLAGHRHAGLGVVDGEDVDRARQVLRKNRSEWYPVVYPELGARRVFIPREHHVEINRPSHLRNAFRQLELDGSDGDTGEAPYDAEVDWPS